jgi:hypothetical protein
MYPSLSREAKAREAAQQRHETESRRRRSQLLADLKTLNARLRERKGRSQ